MRIIGCLIITTHDSIIDTLHHQDGTDLVKSNLIIDWPRAPRIDLHERMVELNRLIQQGGVEEPVVGPENVLQMLRETRKI